MTVTFHKGIFNSVIVMAVHDRRVCAADAPTVAEALAALRRVMPDEFAAALDRWESEQAK